MKVFLFSWQSRACAVEEKWCGAPPLSSLLSVLAPFQQSSASPLPDSLLISSLFYSSVRPNGGRNDGPFLSLFSPRQPFMVSSSSSTVSISLSHCQQLHPSSSFFPASPIFRASVRLNQAARRKWRGVYFKKKKKEKETRSSLPSRTLWLSKCFVRAVGD